jgi:heat shock protein HtpX
MTPIFGLYSHIRSNRIRTVLLLIGLFFLVYLVGYAVSILLAVFVTKRFVTGISFGEDLSAILNAAWDQYWPMLPVVTIGVVAWIVFAYFWHQRLIDAITGSHGLERSDDPELYALLENLCISRGMAVPKLKIMEKPELNAFASGMNDKQYTVTVTRGLREALTKPELETVLAHELTHIRNGDVNLMIICVIVAGIASFLGEMVFRAFTQPRVSTGMTPRRRSWGGSSSSSGGSNKKGGGGAVIVAVIIAVVIIFVAWLMSGVLRLAISRSREYLADAGAVELTKNPDALIAALTKISRNAELPNMPSGVMELCIENPSSGFIDLFATHPPIDDRINALVEHMGGKKVDIPWT